MNRAYMQRPSATAAFLFYPASWMEPPGGRTGYALVGLFSPPNLLQKNHKDHTEQTSCRLDSQALIPFLFFRPFPKGKTRENTEPFFSFDMAYLFAFPLFVKKTSEKSDNFKPGTSENGSSALKAPHRFKGF